MKKCIGIICVIFLTSCASHRAQERVSENLEKEDGVYNQQEIAERTHNIILNHPSMTDQQREQMRKLFADVFGQTIQLRSEIGKLKGVLFKTLFDKGDHKAELKIIKSKLLAINQKKMDLMLDALDKSIVILGKENLEKYQGMFRDLEMIHRSDM